MKRTIIITESQLNLIREFENKEILPGDFETAVRNYMEELRIHPEHPKFADFFTINSIRENDLQNKMMDLGLIQKEKEGFNEPENADGKKHSVHFKKFKFFGKNFGDNMNKLYDSYFTKDHKRKTSLNEDGGATAGDAGGFVAGGGALTDTNVGVSTDDPTQGVSYPFGKKKGSVVRRAGYNSQKSGGVTEQPSNVNMGPAMERKPGFSCERKK